MQKLSVLIVDDDALYRRYISQMVEATDLVAGVVTASSAEIAIERLKLTEFDFVLSDLEMAGADGIELLEHVRKHYPHIGVVMVSSFGGIGQEVTLRALQLGALDFIVKADAVNRSWFVGRLSDLFTSYLKKQLNSSQPVIEIEKVESRVKQYRSELFKNSVVDMVIIIASTGGPKAIETVLAGLSRELVCPVIVLQHIPARFTAAMAAHLALKCHVNIAEAADGERLQQKRFYLAPGGQHLLLKNIDGALQFVIEAKDPGTDKVAPSADRLLGSLAQSLHDRKIIVAVLTGMGNDGTDGLRHLRETNTVIALAQDEQSCVVYGMPQSVVKAGLADEVLPPEKIAKRINELCKKV